ncbi:MAG: T9SS type A sorting domain-containing protein [Candidatus Eisenbacteria bacterium]|uniref:T9SS type A sorting domain-containing protein n=1 Tax=Eiseniibacteriota bacterium TaxID=2212470 RepID=A0A933SAN5_UNCEI|nr:T9SS type A sorting domain-containing protein [Candidatus Eisenbacteria bacterium]
MESSHLARTRLPRLLVLFSSVLVSFVCLSEIPAANASVLSTTDATAIAAFRSGRTVLNFDELTVPPGPCYVPFPVHQYSGLGISISARADGSAQTHLARLPDCGHFGSTLTLPNIIGGGTGPGSLAWRETIRFDFPSAADAIGASSDWSGSNTTLTAYRSDGSVIASVSGNEGNFMGIAEPGIAYAIWKWNYDMSVAGFSLDNVTFHIPQTDVPERSPSTSFGIEPNPVQAETWLRWTMPNAGRVRVSVQDVAGRRVATIVDEQRPAGEASASWKAVDDRGARVPAGVYFVRFEIPGETVTRRLVRIR